MRSLRSWEIVAQLLHVRADASLPVTGAVFMGQGEPFLNYDAVLEAAYTLCDPAGGRMDARRISISTAGVVPMIRRYTAEGHKFRLCVSLNAAIPWKRRALMPIEEGFPLDELVEAIREHAARRGRVTLEYVMIAGVNTGEEDAVALGRLLAGIPIRLNPIAVNDASGRYRPPDEAVERVPRRARARAAGSRSCAATRAARTSTPRAACSRRGRARRRPGRRGLAQPSATTIACVTAKNTAATMAAAGMVRTQAQMIRPATPQRTARVPFVEPTPTIAPMVCVVETGMP